MFLKVRTPKDDCYFKQLRLKCNIVRNLGIVDNVLFHCMDATFLVLNPLPM